MKKLRIFCLLVMLGLFGLCGCSNSDNETEVLKDQMEELQKQNEELSNKLDEMGQKTDVGVTEVPEATMTPAPTNTHEPTPEITSTPIPEPTPTCAPLPTAAPEPTSTPTPIPTAIPTPKPTSTPKPTATLTPTATPKPVDNRIQVKEDDFLTYRNEIELTSDNWSQYLEIGENERVFTDAFDSDSITGKEIEHVLRCKEGVTLKGKYAVIECNLKATETERIYDINTGKEIANELICALENRLLPIPNIQDVDRTWIIESNGEGYIYSDSIYYRDEIYRIEWNELKQKYEIVDNLKGNYRYERTTELNDFSVVKINGSVYEWVFSKEMWNIDENKDKYLLVVDKNGRKHRYYEDGTIVSSDSSEKSIYGNDNWHRIYGR